MGFQYFSYQYDLFIFYFSVFMGSIIIYMLHIKYVGISYHEQQVISENNIRTFFKYYRPIYLADLGLVGHFFFLEKRCLKNQLSCDLLLR